MRICVSPAAIVIACAVAMLTVLISAWIPSKRATRVSAVEAVRQSKDIKAEKKPVRTPKIVYKLFGLSGMLAHKHYKRSKRKYRATVMSLFMSIVLFISASAFTDYLMGTASESFSTYGYDLRFYLSRNDIERISPEEVLELIEEDEYVDGAAYTQVSSYICSVPVSSLSEDAVEMMHLDNNSSSISEAELETTIYFLKDETFRELLEENNLSEDKFMNPEAPLAVAVDGSIEYDPEQEKYFNINYLNSDDCEFSYNALRNFEGYYFAGGAEDANGNLVYRFINQEDESDYMELSKEEATFEIEMKSGKTIYEKPFYISDYAELILIYPHSVMESVVSGDTASYSHVFLIKSEQHTQCSASLKKKLYENRITSSNLYDYAAEVEEERNIITIIKVFAYGFIILISLIAAANVFNTISTNISLRRREFAMLKSIGMTNSGFNKMMNYECILYGTKALLLGLPASFGVTYLIYKSVIAGYNTVFRLPWGAVGIAVLSVFAVVFATMLYSMSKVKKDNPIDALKNENI
ncbi:MAG: ABC transporter permease [Ruminococcus sp.]|nr:ABC transporter permease [Ruminococcus sp.]